MTSRAEHRQAERERRRSTIDAGERAVMDDLLGRSIDAAAKASGMTYDAMDTITEAEMIIGDAAGDEYTPHRLAIETADAMMDVLFEQDSGKGPLLKTVLGKLSEEIGGDLDALLSQLLSGQMVRATSVLEKAAAGQVDTSAADYFFVTGLVARVLEAHKREQR